MPFATTHTVSLHGAQGHLIDVQSDVSPGQVGVTLVGRPDASLNEARDRCRMALLNSGLGWPGTKRITILLSPADLLKSGTHFDLAIAVSVLAAAGDVPVVGARRAPRSWASSRSPATCAASPGCCRWCWPPRRAASRGCSCRSRRPTRRRWCPG